MKTKAPEREQTPDAIVIKQTRIDAGLTQRESAEWVGITTRAWQYYEAGTVSVPTPTWRLFLSLIANRPASESSPK